MSLTLLYDVISPYSYLGFEIFCRYRPIWRGIEMKLQPVFLGGIMNGAGNKPPGFVPAKASYMLKDLTRMSSYAEVPLNIPANITEVLFKKGSMNAQRLLTAVSLEDPQYLEKLSRALFQRVWLNDEDITSSESLLTACIEAELPDAERYVNLITDPSVKQALIEATNNAVDIGVFGAPAIVNDDNEFYFGSDRFQVIAADMGLPWHGPQQTPRRLTKSSL